MSLKEEGNNLSKSLQCPFLDVSSSDKLLLQNNGNTEEKDLIDFIFSHEKLEDALRALIESIKQRSGLLKIAKSVPPSNANNTEPDIR